MTIPQPPRAGTEQERAHIRACLRAGSFSEATTCRVLAVADLDDIDGPARLDALQRATTPDLATFLVRVLVLGGTVPRTDLLAAGLDEPTWASFERTQLLVDDPILGVYAPVRLVPLAVDDGDPLCIASDRSDHPDGSRFVPFDDIVFSGHNPLTRQFLRLIPLRQTGRVLELCAGTAVGALAAARSAGAVVAVDVTDRCTRFAEFNVWLNGTTAVDVRCGSLYEPVRGERFDMVLAHPPYVPSLQDRLIYRDGGESGERLLRQIVEGLPDALQPGGTCHLLSIGLDTADGLYEARVRRWLGDASDDFDIVFALGSAMPPSEFAQSLVARSMDARPGDLEQWQTLFDRLTVQQVVYGAMVLRRLEGAGAGCTRRVAAGPRTTPDAFTTFLRWLDWSRRPDFNGRLLAASPGLVDGAGIELQQQVVGGRAVPVAALLSHEESPFRVHLRTDPWVAVALTGFDGVRTVRDVYEATVSGGLLPGDMTRDAFVDVVAMLIEKGFLRWQFI